MCKRCEVPRHGLVRYWRVHDKMFKSWYQASHPRGWVLVLVDSMRGEMGSPRRFPGRDEMLIALGQWAGGEPANHFLHSPSQSTRSAWS